MGDSHRPFSVRTQEQPSSASQPPQHKGDDGAQVRPAAIRVLNRINCGALVTHTLFSLRQATSLC